MRWARSISTPSRSSRNWRKDITSSSNQHDDLVSSKTELLEVIERINTETQRLFAETFAQVRDQLPGDVQGTLRRKGQADLTLLDENDPLESGIEVIAKPPGKKLQSITLLSGGERSMTAVALLFSIYMIKPSPFCVLDELDAPLDESNIGRFVKVLDRFIDRSQFIIVTHSKRTMARADVMYGVTMEEFGVSKPVGMRLTSRRRQQVRQGSEIRRAESRPQARLVKKISRQERETGGGAEVRVDPAPPPRIAFSNSGRRNFNLAFPIDWSGSRAISESDVSRSEC
jgi:DNA repair ATPase RecN